MKDRRKYELSEESINKNIIKKRQEELDLLLELANADLSDKNYNFQNRTIDFFSQHPALHPKNKGKTPELELDKLVGLLQRHLQFRLKKIIKNINMLGDMPLWSISGTVNFSISPINSCFTSHFQLQKVKLGNEYKAYKKVIDLMMYDIIQGLGFAVWRFGQCSRCGTFYCNATAQKRIYCSIKCANAARKQKYMERKKGKKDK